MSTRPEFDAFHKQLFEEGLKVRRSVFGDAYVDKALAGGSSEFSRPGQELVTEWCWGHVWTRPGLELKQRSLLSEPIKTGIFTRSKNLTRIWIDLGMLIALKSWPELAIHTRGAINNGLSEVEIREAVLQSSIYLGVPAGVEAMKVTERVLKEMAENGEHTRQLKEKV
jgi:4-carboxymuconolactone decarboxylase